MAHCHDCLAVGSGEACVVGLFVDKGCHFSCAGVDGEHGRHAVFGGDEENLSAVGCPCELVDGVVPCGCKIALFGCEAIQQEKTVFIGFVTVVLHAEPCQIFTVGRECGHGVVAVHAFGQIAGFAVFKIIDIEVGVGGHRIFQTCLFA